MPSQKKLMRRSTRGLLMLLALLPLMVLAFALLCMFGETFPEDRPILAFSATPLHRVPQQPLESAQPAPAA